MRARENYTPYVVITFVLTLGILLLFQAYILREPGRIAEDEKRDELIAVTVGSEIYAENCVKCHGEQGEGIDGPPLNDKTFLNNTSNKTIFSLVGSGVPSSEMPAWGQVIGDKGVDVSMEYQSYGDYITLRSGDIVIPKIGMTEPLKIECCHFIDCIERDQTPVTDGRDGLRVVRVLAAGQESLRKSGAPVSLR